MSWSPHNLFNLFQRTVGQKSNENDFTRSSLTLFQQRWKAKRILRAYHGDHIPEQKFQKWYLPRSIPDVRPRKIPFVKDLQLNAFRGSQRHVRAQQRLLKENKEQALAPVASLMWSEVERRMDVFVFRCCFAESVYEARRLIVHGYVKLNGRKHSNPNTRLAPGDMVSVEPSVMRMLKPPKSLPSPEKKLESEESLLETNPVSDSDAVEASKYSSDSLSSPSASDLSPLDPSSNPSQNNSPRTLYHNTLTPFTLPPFAYPWLFIPAYIEVSFATCSAIYLRHPTARPGYSEIPTPYEADGELMRLCWEWYVKRRPRVRSLKKLSEGPENRMG